MVTLKDVAALAKVSLSTVSIIVNGKAQERNISPATQTKVHQAIAQLGYQPNVAARRLRYSLENRPRIVLFWPFDIRTNMLSALLNGINRQLEQLAFDCELVIQTYKNDHIEQSAKDLLTNAFNGIIVGGSSQIDIQFLESLKSPIPIILLNRESTDLSTVSVKADKIAKLAIDLFLQKQITNVTVVASKSNFSASNQRTQAFIQQCQAKHISITPRKTLAAINSYEGGIAIAKDYLTLKNKATTIFCETDVIALGMLYYFNNQKIRIPQDIQILSIGTLGREQTQYVTPAISIIDVPSEKIARTALNILAEKIQRKGTRQIIHQEVEPELYIRDSLPN